MLGKLVPVFIAPVIIDAQPRETNCPRLNYKFATELCSQQMYPKLMKEIREKDNTAQDISQKHMNFHVNLSTKQGNFVSNLPFLSCTGKENMVILVLWHFRMDPCVLMVHVR